MESLHAAREPLGLLGGATPSLPTPRAQKAGPPHSAPEGASPLFLSLVHPPSVPFPLPCSPTTTAPRIEDRPTPARKGMSRGQSSGKTAPPKETGSLTSRFSGSGYSLSHIHSHPPPCPSGVKQGPSHPTGRRLFLPLSMDELSLQVKDPLEVLGSSQSHPIPSKPPPNPAAPPFKHCSPLPSLDHGVLKTNVPARKAGLQELGLSAPSWRRSRGLCRAPIYSQCLPLCQPLRAPTYTPHPADNPAGPCP